MRINPGQIRSWLYTSKFTTQKSYADVFAFVNQFRAHNRDLGLSGFLVTDGHVVMQLLEGDDEPLAILRETISADTRHFDVVTEVWELQESRAFPHWSMQVSKSSDYERLFKEIESARIETIATNIARMLFDNTFAG